MRLLVVGGSGFLGREVIRQARVAGTRVAATFHGNALPIAGVDWQALDIRHRDDVTGVLFTDDVRCPVHVTDLASALLELAGSRHSGVHHAAGADAVSRHELGVLIARRDRLDEAGLPTGLRARTGPPGPLDVRLDCTVTQARLTTRLRGAREFLATAPARRHPVVTRVRGR